MQELETQLPLVAAYRKTNRPTYNLQLKEGAVMVRRKPLIFLFLSAAILFFLQNCATVISGTSQKIPVTGNPPGAKITVDGKVMGLIPLNLRLKRKENHVIRIEKQGYNPLEIRVMSESSSTALGILGDALIGWLAQRIAAPMIAYDNGAIFLPWVIGGICFISCVALDYIAGGVYVLSPHELQVTLTEIKEFPRTDLIILKTEQLNNTKWIRIKCS